MARRKKWFLTALWEAGLSPKQAQDIFSRIGFSPEVSDVLIKRFWHGAGILDVDSSISSSEQKINLPKWNKWVEDWFLENKGELNPEQTAKLINFIRHRQL